MTEAQRILYAKTYIDKMANGQNPLTDEYLPDSDLLNNVKITRCLFYVSSLLEELCELKGENANTNTHTDTKPYRNAATQSKKPYASKGKPKFCATQQMTDNFPYRSGGIYTRDIADYFNAEADKIGMRKVYTSAIFAWLTKNGYLLDVTANGISYKTASGKGKQIGIIAEPRKDKEGKYYTTVKIGIDAQKLIVAHINEIAAEQVFDKKTYAKGKNGYNS